MRGHAACRAVSPDTTEGDGCTIPPELTEHDPNELWEEMLLVCVEERERENCIGWFIELMLCSGDRELHRVT